MHVADALQHGHIRRGRHHRPPHDGAVRLGDEPEAEAGHLGGGEAAEQLALLVEGPAGGRRRDGGRADRGMSSAVLMCWLCPSRRAAADAECNEGGRPLLVESHKRT